jgi:serpin B
LLLDALPDQNFPGCRLAVANRLWCQNNVIYKEPFLTTLRDRFHSELGLVNFQQPDLVRNTINTWVEEKTNQKIKELFDPSSINPDNRLAMTSVIYLKGFWAQSFDKSATRQKPFYARNKEIPVQLMYRKGMFRYSQDNALQILEKPYLGDYLSMLILLPKDSNVLSELEKSLSEEKLREWSNSLHTQEVEIYLPRFKLETSYDMIPTLRSMGMKNAFDSNADFAGISADTKLLWLNTVVHKACVQVDEEGTEAASATGIGGFFGGPLSLPIFRANHPFVFLICDKRTGSILFMGRVIEPQSD